MIDKYYVSKVDEGVWMVIDSEGDGLEYCICSDFEEGLQDAEKRANNICVMLNLQEKAKFITLDKSEDYEEMSFGVNLNEQSDNDYQAINVWNDLGDAVSEKDELIHRDVAGDWAVYALIEIEPETFIITEEL